MSITKIKSGDILYLKITDGRLRRKSNSDDPEAEKRVVKMDGVKHVMYENNFSKIEGFITDLRLKEHPDFGDSVEVVVEDNEGTKEVYVAQMGENSRYFQSFLQLLPNVDFSLPIIIKPYSYKEEGDKYANQGVSLLQNDEKLSNYYKKWNEKKKKSKLLNGMEKFDFSKADSKDEKKILRIKLVSFLKKELTKQQKRLQEFLDSLENKKESKKDKKPKKLKSPKKSKRSKKDENSKDDLPF